ncbi:MAG TPA: heavy metal sensor histidine kinase [Rhodocyclaceae bacterium]|jgi:two-component system heavy metal sensor histidine kinase CusS
MRTLIGRKSITVRLTLLFATVSTAILLLLGLLIGTLVEHHFEELDMETLNGKMELLQTAIGNIRTSEELSVLSTKLDGALVGHHGLAVLVTTHDRQNLFLTSGAIFPDEVLTQGSNKMTSTLWTDTNHSTYRGIAARVPTGIPGGKPLTVAISTNLSTHEHFMSSFQITLWLVVGAAALLTGFLGWVVARRGLAPLRIISQGAADITANSLDQRLAVATIPLELAEVAETLNGMLARLQESFRRLSDFSSDLAHELRTPVSNLLTQTQVTLSKSRTAEEYKNVLASNSEEFERLSRMIADMLFLAKADNDLIIPHQERIDLAEETKGILEFYEIVAEDKGIKLTCSGGGQVLGDRLMLRRAINNILSNAIRHTPQGGMVAIQIDSDGEKVKWTVENTGNTIPAEHLPRLFDRFYRVDASRQRFSDGAGLGLAITQSILRAHGGTASVFSHDGVTRFDLILPKVIRIGAHT